jgi:hypothetical protein
MNETQEEAIFKWLLSGRTLTQLEAYERFQCTRLAARIRDLRQAIPVKTEWEKVGKKRYARYSIEGDTSVTF